jgi:hypothetical protein
MSINSIVTMDTVFLNGFSLEVISDEGPVEKIIHKGSNYFALHNGSEYKLKLGNDHKVRVDAHVSVDEEKVGVWRINPYSTVTVERPANIARKFTLLRERSRMAINAGIESGYKENGLIKVIFRPEKEYLPELVYNNPTHYQETDNRPQRWNCYNNYSDTVTPHNFVNRRCHLEADEYEDNSRQIYGVALQSTFSNSLNGSTYASGGTAFGDDSLQRFKRVVPLDEINKNLETTIYVRLVVQDDKTTYKRPYIGVRQASRTNKIPPRMDIGQPEHLGRSHKCHKDSPFTLSKKYWFDNMY